ncbi:pyridoxamine 5'-phosphate oxidase family protein [Longispora albida]|uniref:pyridoxamine 5'-phosphate oxidase family protein n=1 Tax=Longispora albida TaxID=203523 RepID=UPI0003772CD8|nr:hypothetical protein [Longispora albida]
MAEKVERFADIEAEFARYVTDIKYATMTTVDKLGRPRSRVLFPIWELTGGKPVGWLASYRTKVKAAHLAGNPHTTYSYWSPRQNAVHVDSRSAWEDDPAVKARVWELYRAGSPAGLGYDPARYWESPADPGFHVIRIEPWRVQVVRGTDLRSLIWQP